eukprot:6479522-Amphidinium_carterae.2
MLPDPYEDHHADHEDSLIKHTISQVATRGCARISQHCIQTYPNQNHKRLLEPGVESKLLDSDMTLALPAQLRQSTQRTY